jgi:hypothetical protein
VRHTKNRDRFGARVTAAFTLALKEVNLTKSDADVGREESKTAISVINVSKRLKTDTNAASSMSEVNLQWLREHFKCDFELFESARVQFHSGRGQWKAVF